MKIEKFKNLVLSLGKALSIFSIAVTLLVALLIFLSKLFTYNDIFQSIYWLNEIIMTCFGICCFYGSIYILPALLGLSFILTSIIAFKNHNAKEFLDLRFLIILTDIFLPLGLILLSENF
ncbi:MAG: hypothetical protein E7556_03630 [Ruminococcaceae bacterium]|nr:hypothetical protein [Oscillospiraceae bacterium]